MGKGGCDMTENLDTDALRDQADRSRAILDALPARSRPAWYHSRVNDDDAWWESLVRAECKAGHIVYVDDGDGTVYACPSCALADAREGADELSAMATRAANRATDERIRAEAAEDALDAFREAVERLCVLAVSRLQDQAEAAWVRVADLRALTPGAL